MSGKQRISVGDVDPAAYQAVQGMERYVREKGLEPLLLELVKIRASQLNGCAYCLDMHNRDARAKGEAQRRLDVVGAWREASELFSERERAAMAFTEQVTEIAAGGVSDSVWSEVTTLFAEDEVVTLLMAVVTINVWNRLAVTTHQPLPDVDQPD